MAITPGDRPPQPTMSHSSASVETLNTATPHSSTVAPVPTRRKPHPAAGGSRVLQNHYPPKHNQDQGQPSSLFVPSGLAARAPIVIRPSGRPGFNAPKAATFFLGKDHERWRQYDRERFSGLFGWDRIHSAISSRSGHRGSRGAFSSYSSGSDDELSDSGSYRSSRSRSSRYSGGSRSRRPSEAITPPMTPFDTSNPSSRPRRFSTNGPEAAFQRHETVIGIHTPRRRSSAASDSLPFLRPLAQIHPQSGQPSTVDVPESAFNHIEAPAEPQKRQKKPKHSNDERTSKKKDRKPSKSHTGKPRAKDAPVPNKVGPHGMLDLDEAARPLLRRLRSNLEQAAAAAAASAEASPAIGEAEGEDALEEAVGMQASFSEAALDGKGPLSAQDLRSLLPAHRAVTPRSPLIRTASPRAPPLKLAKRQVPQRVEGTLYDKTGPYREGAVSDGLSVRLFSANPEPRTSSFEDADLSNSEHPITKPWGRRGSSSIHDDDDDNENAVYMNTTRRRSNSSGGYERRPSPRSSSSENDDIPLESAVEDSSQVYLITTPDNRVSSAAKLRRWAMDSDGNFYAAMEIKSIEAKLRAADPTAGRVTRELANELEETYLDDLLDEVQKAQTLNPTRTGAVAKILKTEDERYIRLEEDYPEEAFFVIAGCEEAELNGVILNIFIQAIRILSRFHASGWMHGDVKLENLMFDENGSLVVIDYENANPYRGIPGGDGQVQLVSYDWIPPEACPGPMGRRMGPSGDLWALGCNLIRAFALRDGVEDGAIRETLLGKGQKKFLDKMSKLFSRKEKGNSNASACGVTLGDDYFAPKTHTADGGVGGHRQEGDTGMPWDMFAFLVDMDPILNETIGEEESSIHEARQGSWAERSLYDTNSSSGSHFSSGATPESSIAPSSGRISPKSTTACATETPSSIDGISTRPLPTPARLLYRFARSAPELLVWVLTRCVVESVEQRNVAEAEHEGMLLADWFEKQKVESLKVGRRAVEAAIEMSGSVWVRPRLDEARKSLGID
ncbi:uncharacterized protein MEPE_01318 [Melanopsichium pennsylvanicum]|uniref:Protein kinase domain-containing protein n=2 Tax=Melanopsichium pennsylvanicum TaxID=63383 RepID=A0AAJ4XHV2_9BASI|nr:protein kinase domain containing protein [Melanopsichium pennsylvanicum 4]SNX82612.1 uncharacterized protein MEPE_01318 [Melanopsichium pennsylvanicum]